MTHTNQSMPTSNERGRKTRNGGTSSQVIQQFTAMQGTIKAFAVYTLNSFKQISSANVDK